MANNRLYLRDSDTGETFLLAKSFGTGWLVAPTEAELQDWIEGRDGHAAFGNCQKPETTLQLLTEYQLPPPPASDGGAE